MAERKRPRRTRERILETSLELFNRLGEPHVTTAHIADEMNISPGNLYYHFRNKDEIIGELYAAFEAGLLPLLDVPPGRRIDVEDLWLLLHLLFEQMWRYRFLYRDLDELASRNRKLALRFGERCQQRIHCERQLGALARRRLDIVEIFKADFRTPAAPPVAAQVGRDLEQPRRKAS
jgi:AcrR family transcriptional regulator